MIVGVAVGTLPLLFLEVFDFLVDTILIDVAYCGDVNILHPGHQVGQSCAATTETDKSELDLIHLSPTGLEKLQLLDSGKD